jgi:DNA replication licensing factor MCM6
MMHVMVDEPDAVEDRLIASHIVDVHRQRDALTFGRVPYKMDDMQRYIKYARAIKPELSDHVRRRPWSSELAIANAKHPSP